MLPDGATLFEEPISSPAIYQSGGSSSSMMNETPEKAHLRREVQHLNESLKNTESTAESFIQQVKVDAQDKALQYVED